MASVYGYVTRNMMAPFLELMRGTQTMKCLRALEISQWWPREKIIEIQDNRLRRLVQHAYNHVPYYRRMFNEMGLNPDSIRGINDLAKLPVLTKSQVRKYSQELLADNVADNHRVKLITGGTSGKPLQFYRSKTDQLNWSYAAAQRAQGWAGYHLGNKTVNVGSPRPYNSIKQHLTDASKKYLQRTIVIDSKDFSVNTLAKYVEKINRFKPEFIRGYPSAIELIAQYILTSDSSVVKPKAIITGAEQLYDRQRDLFSSVFGCDTFSNYSSWEVHAIAAECSCHNGFHISAENVIVEVTDEQGNPVPEGHEGFVTITNLHNYAMPFIRYNLEDLAVYSNKECPCGRGLPLLTKLNGRVTDIIKTRSGKIITGTVLISLFMTPPGVIQFQFVQPDYDNLIIKIVMDKEYSKEHLDNLTVNLSNKYKAIVGEDVKVAVEYVENIPVTESGKYIPVISHLNT